MTPKEQYSEKLKDPRWQRKRLAIFERDEWKMLRLPTEGQNSPRPPFEIR